MPFSVPYAPSSIFQPNGRLVDLIRLKGEQDAESQRRVGELQARMWGNLGQQITDGVGNFVKAQQQAPINALNQLKIADATHESQSKTALADTMRMRDMSGPMPQGEPRPAPSNPYLKQEGDVSVWDVEGLSKAMAAQGFGDLTSSVVKDISSLNDAHRTEAKARRDFGDAQQNVLARGAGTILSILKDHPDADPAMVTNLVGQQMAANSTFPPAQIQQTIQQLLSDPTTLRTKLETLSKLGTIAPIKLDKDVVLLSGANPSGAPIASNVVPDKLGAADLEKTAMDAYARQAAGTATPADLSTITAWEKTHPHPAPPVESAQSIDKLVLQPDGKTWTPTTLMFDPKTKKYTDASGKEIADAATHIRPIPSASAVAINAGQLSDVAMEQAARKYIETGELPPVFGTAGTVQKTAIMNAAAKLDPTAALARNKATYKADSANLTNLQKTEGTLSAFEKTASKNLDQFLSLADKIPDTGVPWVNAPIRAVNAQGLGSADQAAFNAARDVALREIARVTNDPKLSGALTDSARKEVAGLSAANATFAQIKAVAKVLKQDMANVHSGLNEQIAGIKNAMGQNPGAAKATDPLGIR